LCEPFANELGRNPLFRITRVAACASRAAGRVWPERPAQIIEDKTGDTYAIVTLRIPDGVAAKANTFPESSYGATTVTLVLSDGTLITDVVLAGASDIVKVQGKRVSDAADLGFRVDDIVDVTQKSGLSLRLSQAWRRRRRPT
jgi:hypothetical protein